MSNKYPDPMIEEYIGGLKHSERCKRETKGFIQGDGRVAMIELPDKNLRYYIYVCRDCGGNYYSKENIEEIHYFERK
jgi:hypothetical protein